MPAHLDVIEGILVNDLDSPTYECLCSGIVVCDYMLARLGIAATMLPYLAIFEAPVLLLLQLLPVVTVVGILVICMAVSIERLNSKKLL